MQPKKMNCDLPWCDIIEMAYEAPTPAERRVVIAFFIRYLNRVIDPLHFDKPRNAQMETEMWYAFNAVRYACHDELFHGPVWKWMHGFLSEIGGSAQCAFLTGVFCAIVVGPIPWDDPYETASVEHILECYHDPRTRWVAVESFGECTFPEALATLDKYNQWRTEHGRSKLQMDVTLLKRETTD